ncbi:unnamed protein product [Lota lota]
MAAKPIRPIAETLLKLLPLGHHIWACPPGREGGIWPDTPSCDSVNMTSVASCHIKKHRVTSSGTVWKKKKTITGCTILVSLFAFMDDLTRTTSVSEFTCILQGKEEK